MRYVNNLLNVLKSNNLVKLTAETFLPKKISKSVSTYLNKDKRLRIYFENKLVIIDPENKSKQGLVPVFYWDSNPNFGDSIGPYLLSKITGKPVINICHEKESGIMAVGSILQLVDREDMVIWGSGLIEKPKNEVLKNIKKYNPKILSIRGMETAKCLIEAGVKIPNKSVYGDPALILPLFYKPLTSSKNKIGICPHYIHKSHFLRSITDNNILKIIDVQKDMESVVDEISSSTICISTSLHGLIIAQAYGVPWVWLEVCDNNLRGNDFKFRDFFSTLDESQVSHIRITLEQVGKLDYEAIAKKAYLPDKRYDEKLILETLEIHLRMKNKN